VSSGQWRAASPNLSCWAERPGAADSNSCKISDSHIGFNKPANADVNATLQIAIDKINALPKAPDFLIHTGDLTHTAKPAEFDTLGQLLQSSKAKQVFYVPGEHDNATDDGKEYLSRFGKGTKGTGWHSFDQHGVHFVGLVNSAALEGMGKLGADQLAWLNLVPSPFSTVTFTRPCRRSRATLRFTRRNPQLFRNLLPGRRPRQDQ
jgi:3',5'-cyclic AMP phosphodiesterase CpdA